MEVGSIIVATGFDTYEPAAGEFGYGIDGVVTLPEFKSLLDAADGRLTFDGRPVRDIAYVYCVGSRAGPTRKAATRTARATAAPPRSQRPSSVSKRDPGVHQYHLYRDMRTYGKLRAACTPSRASSARST